MASPNPIKFLNVKVDVAATPPSVTYSGDCDADGEVRVTSTPTDIWVMLWTVDASGNQPPAQATLKDLSWTGGQPPPWVASSQPSHPAGQTNPAWVLTSSSTSRGDQASYQLDLEYQGAPITVDPTIINADGGNLLPKRRPASEDDPEKPPADQRTAPAASGLSTPAGPPAGTRRRNSGSERRRSNQGRLNHRAS